MTKKALLSFIVLLFVLTGCSLEGKLNNEGGYILLDDKSLTIIEFDTKQGNGKAKITEHRMDTYYDEVVLEKMRKFLTY